MSLPVLNYTEAMCDGDVDAGSMVDEEWLLDLERHHFMQLLATQKTRDRVGIYAEEREAAAELMKSYCETMLLGWNPLKNAHLLFVDSAFSPISVLPDRLSRRFSRRVEILTAQV